MTFGGSSFSLLLKVNWAMSEEDSELEEETRKEDWTRRSYSTTPSIYSVTRTEGRLKQR